ncbi:hypothetical protein JB92DRAFT_3111642 [Gautieria morchelliformis]|nr:hypothetical protein JB92DRAFT_3111642 [Gautieria morchelliformis]
MATAIIAKPLPSLNGWVQPPTIPGHRPVPYLSHVGKGGKDALWVGFVVFLVSTLVVAVMMARQQKKYRGFHLLTMLVAGIATLSYYAMAVGSGSTYVKVGVREVQGQKTVDLRQIFWAREVDWALTTPLLLLELALLAGLPWLEIMSLLIVNEAMAATRLFSALHPGQAAAKWGWYAFSCLFLLGIFYMLIWNGRQCAQARPSSLSQLYTQLALYTIVLWLIYPIIFALGEGASCISSSAETIAYTILDIFAKAMFGLWLLARHKHDSAEESAMVLPESWTEPRGAKAGAIRLPGEED